RRHTRFSRDWSSDVCSSDLPLQEQWPQGFRAGQFVEAEFGFRLAEQQAGTVVKQKTVAVAADGKGYVELFGVIQRLLHAIAQPVFVVFGFDNGNGFVGLVVQYIVGAAGGATAG